MMGQDTFSTTQGNSEGGVAPLAACPPPKSPWAPIARKVAATTLGGLGLAAIGAISMAHTGNPAGATTSGTAFASVLAPTEWLAPGGPASAPAPIAVDAAPSNTAEAAPAPRGGTEPKDATPPVASGPAATRCPCNPADSAPTQVPTSAGRLPDGRVILNSATPSDLTTLPGIGQKRAEAIIALRTKLKGFRKLSDLLRVKGIGVKSLRKLEPKLVLDPPSGPS